MGHSTEQLVVEFSLGVMCEHRHFAEHFRGIRQPADRERSACSVDLPSFVEMLFEQAIAGHEQRGCIREL